MSRFSGLSLAVAGSVFLAGTAVSNAAVISNFEAPTYTADQDVVSASGGVRGVDGWGAIGWASGSGVVTPYTSGGFVPPAYPILEGSQSFFLVSGATYNRGWGSAASEVADGASVSALVRIGDPYSTAGRTVSFDITPVISGFGTLAGIRLNTGTHTFSLAGTNPSALNVGYLDQTTYKLEMVLDFTNKQINACATDITNSGPQVSLGTSGFNDNTVTASYLAANGGVMIGKNGSYVFFDDFQVNAIPEPAALSLLGFGGLMMLRRRK